MRVFRNPVFSLQYIIFELILEVQINWPASKMLEENQDQGTKGIEKAKYSFPLRKLEGFWTSLLIGRISRYSESRLARGRDSTKTSRVLLVWRLAVAEQWLLCLLDKQKSCKRTMKGICCRTRISKVPCFDPKILQPREIQHFGSCRRSTQALSNI